jgi:hypothetical protein
MSDPLKFWVQIAAIIGAIIAVLTFLIKATPWIKTKMDRRSIKRRVGAESYSANSLKNASRYFVPPLCQDIDPAGGEEPRAVYGVKQKLFDVFDDALGQPEYYKYLILLADSGMGKTTALLNYQRRYLKRWRKPNYNLYLIPLNTPDVDTRIASIPEQENTVLFLDALDEDTLAIVDYVERLRLLLVATTKFRCVLISCRTQFFSKDEELPKETGRIRVEDRRAGQEAEYCFQKIYLSPFTDDQVNQYIKHRYGFRRKKRKLAVGLVKKMPHLTARPMLLAHLDDVLKSRRNFKYSYQLYQEMIEAWLRREKGMVKEIEINDLRNFSELLAVDLYLNRAERKSERLPKEELATLADHWRIPLDEWKLTGRSLLNRDAEGNYKFAHRSIMEYLFIVRFFHQDKRTLQTEWTDQMHVFLWEMVRKAFDDFSNNNERSAVEVFQPFLFQPCFNYFVQAVSVVAGRTDVRLPVATAEKFVAFFSARLLKENCKTNVAVSVSRLRRLTLADRSSTDKTFSFSLSTHYVSDGTRIIPSSASNLRATYQTTSLSNINIESAQQFTDDPDSVTQEVDSVAQLPNLSEVGKRLTVLIGKDNKYWLISITIGTQAPEIFVHYIVKLAVLLLT